MRRSPAADEQGPITAANDRFEKAFGPIVAETDTRKAGPLAGIQVSAAFGWAAAALLAGAGVIHLAFAGDHMTEYLPFGIAFYVMGVGQLAGGLAVGLWSRSRRVLGAAVVANLALCELWLVTRTMGLPMGADHWTPEKVGVADSVCVAFQLAVAVLLGVLLSARPGFARLRRHRVSLRAAGAALLAVVLFVGPVTIHASRTGHEMHSDGAMQKG